MEIPSATSEGIEYYEDHGLDRAEVSRYATCGYIEEGHHISLKGATGSGKTYLACAACNAACRKIKTVRYGYHPDGASYISFILRLPGPSADNSRTVMLGHLAVSAVDESLVLRVF